MIKKVNYRMWMKVARAKQGMKQKKLAELVGKHSVTISLIESGLSNPSVKLACAIAAILKVDPLDFIEFEASTYWEVTQ